MMTKHDRYQLLLDFVQTLGDESVYEKFENLNELSWAARELLIEIRGK